MRSTDRLAGELPALGHLGPGAHVCCVVDSAARFDAWTTACLAEGARHGQKLFRFAPQASLPASPVGPPTPKATVDDRAAPEASVDRPAVNEAVDAVVTLADPHVAFLGCGPVDPAAMYAMFRRETETARREGYQGLRLVADMDWLLARPPGRPDLAAFELLLDEVVTELGATVVCAYRTGSFDAATIADMVALHPVTVGGVPAGPGFRMWNVARGVWAVSGEVDHFNVESFGRALATATATAADGARTLRLRAAGLRFIAVTGIQALARLASTRPELRLVIEDAGVAFRRCWALLDLDRYLPGVAFEPAPAEPAAARPAPAGPAAVGPAAVGPAAVVAQMAGTRPVGGAR